MQHEQRKRQQEDEKKREEDQRKEKVRKASALLQGMKKTSEKREREYRGIVNSRAAEYEKAHAKLSSAPSSDHHKANLNRTTPSNGRPHPMATTSGKQTTATTAKKSVEPPQSAKGKTKPSSKPTSSKSAVAPSASGNPKSLSTSKPSSSTARLKAAVPSPSSSLPGTKRAVSGSRGPAGQKTPVNFQELMKLAQQKKSMQSSDSGKPRGGDVAVSGPPSRTDTRPGEKDRSAGRSQSGSPLGKQLLERSSARGRNGLGRGGGERKTASDSPQDGSVGSRGVKEVAVSDRPTAAGKNLRELAQSRVVGRGGSGVEVGGGVGRGNSQRMPESALLMRERFRKELEASANGGGSNTANPSAKPSAKSNSFYASSHGELSKEGRPNFSKRKQPSSGPYRSSWVSEMNEYVEQLREVEGEGLSDEEGEGLDDFVVEDDEGDDVSSAIREIFGYDRRRSVRGKFECCSSRVCVWVCAGIEMRMKMIG